MFWWWCGCGEGGKVDEAKERTTHRRHQTRLSPPSHLGSVPPASAMESVRPASEGVDHWGERRGRGRRGERRKNESASHARPPRSPAPCAAQHPTHPPWHHITLPRALALRPRLGRRMAYVAATENRERCPTSREKQAPAPALGRCLSSTHLLSIPHLQRKRKRGQRQRQQQQHLARRRGRQQASARAAAAFGRGQHRGPSRGGRVGARAGSARERGGGGRCDFARAKRAKPSAKSVLRPAEQKTHPPPIQSTRLRASLHQRARPRPLPACVCVPAPPSTHTRLTHPHAPRRGRAGGKRSARRPAPPRRHRQALLHGGRQVRERIVCVCVW